MAIRLVLVRHGLSSFNAKGLIQGRTDDSILTEDGYDQALKAGKALSKKLFKIEVINIRDFSDNKSNSVDEKPFGGGAGMIIKPDVMQNALDYATKDNIKNKKIIKINI